MGVLAKYIDKPEIKFEYSPALSNTYFYEPVYFKILVSMIGSEITWNFLDLTQSKFLKIVDFDLMYADISRKARRKMEKQLQVK